MLVAVDSSEKWINGLNSLKIGNIKTVCYKVQEADFQENEFDTVFCRFGLCWFRDVKLVLENITKWLKPGGRFACIEPIFSGGLMYPTVRGMLSIHLIVLLFSCSLLRGGDNDFIISPRLKNEPNKFDPAYVLPCAQQNRVE